MLTHPLDTSRLTRDIQALIADCIHLKSLLRARRPRESSLEPPSAVSARENEKSTRWTRPMAEEQRRHIRVRRKLTELFILLTASRNRMDNPKPRLHVIQPPREVRDAGGPDFDPKTWNALDYNRTIATRLLPDYAVATIAMSEVRSAS